MLQGYVGVLLELDYNWVQLYKTTNQAFDATILGLNANPREQAPSAEPGF